MSMNEHDAFEDDQERMPGEDVGQETLHDVSAIPAVELEDKAGRLASLLTLTVCSGIVAALLTGYAYILYDENGKREDLLARRRTADAQKVKKQAEALALPPEYAQATHAQMVLPYMHGADSSSQRILGAMWQQAPKEARNGLGFRATARVTGRVEREAMEDFESFLLRLSAAYARSRDEITVEFTKIPGVSVFAAHAAVPMAYLKKPEMLSRERLIWPPSSFHIAFNEEITMVVENGRLTGILEKGVSIPFDGTVEEIYQRSVMRPLKK